MGLFIRRQSYRRAHDPAIFCNTLNQWRDDQERYWQRGSRMSNTLLSAKQSTGNLSRPAAEDIHGLADVQNKGLQAVSHQPSTFTELCAFASRLKPIFCEISEAPTTRPTTPRQSRGLAWEAQLVPQYEHFDRNLLQLWNFFYTKKRNEITFPHECPLGGSYSDGTSWMASGQ